MNSALIASREELEALETQKWDLLIHDASFAPYGHYLSHKLAHIPTVLVQTTEMSWYARHYQGETSKEHFHVHFCRPWRQCSDLVTRLPIHNAHAMVCNEVL